jgi:hypothetical protein
MSLAMVRCLGHSYLDMEQGLNLIPALAKWKIDLEDQICHGIICFVCCILIGITACGMLLVCASLCVTVAINYGTQNTVICLGKGIALLQSETVKFKEGVLVFCSF